MAEVLDTPAEEIDDEVIIADKPREPTQYEKRLRAESKAHRLRAAQAEKDRDDAVTRSKTENEALIAAANKRADERVLRSELKAAALKAGMVDLDGLKLADLSKVKLQENGDIEGADALMEEMKKAKPYLFGKPGSSTSSTDDPPPKGDTKAKSAKEMTPEEHKAERAKLTRKK